MSLRKSCSESVVSSSSGGSSALGRRRSRVRRREPAARQGRARPRTRPRRSPSPDSSLVHRALPRSLLAALARDAAACERHRDGATLAASARTERRRLGSPARRARAPALRDPLEEAASPPCRAASSGRARPSSSNWVIAAVPLVRPGEQVAEVVVDRSGCAGSARSAARAARRSATRLSSSKRPTAAATCASTSPGSRRAASRVERLGRLLVALGLQRRALLEQRVVLGRAGRPG